MQSGILIDYWMMTPVKIFDLIQSINSMVFKKLNIVSNDVFCLSDKETRWVLHAQYKLQTFAARVKWHTYIQLYFIFISTYWLYCTRQQSHCGATTTTGLLVPAVQYYSDLRKTFQRYKYICSRNFLHRMGLLLRHETKLKNINNIEQLRYLN